MSAEKFMDQYIGDITGGLVREAAMLKAQCAYLETVVKAKDKELDELKGRLASAPLEASQAA